uniref:Uncharacterized protein n=1 Tax=Tetranychus urticae TaxID=32264 RepID=T1KBG8_TETUR
MKARSSNHSKKLKGYLVRNRLSKMELAACRIQKWWRSYVRQRRYERPETLIVNYLYNATASVLKHWIKYVVDNKFCNDNSNQSNCVDTKQHQDSTNERDRKLEATALTIQANWKGYLAQKRFIKMKLAACKIQREWRSYVNISTIQKHWRGYLARKNFAMMTQKPDHSKLDGDQKPGAAALIIQKHWKGYLARKQFSKMKLAACKIQKWWRSYINQRKFDRRDKFVVDVPYNATSTIQKHWRGYKLHKDFAMIAQKKHYIIPVLQNHTSQDFAQIKDTPALLLGFRTDIAFEKLINCRKFCQLQAALSSLETTTNKGTAPIIPEGFYCAIAQSIEPTFHINRPNILFLYIGRFHGFLKKDIWPVYMEGWLYRLRYCTISSESCCKIASPSTVDTILDIIKSSNRSEPSKLVISHAFSILLSLVKFEKTQDLVVDCRAVIDICIEKAKVHNKVENIFCKCLTLIYLMVVKSSNRDAIISDLKINKNLMSLIALEASFIKSHKKRKISKEIVFYPYWSSAKNVTYEFTDRFTALEHVNYIFKSKLF